MSNTTSNTMPNTTARLSEAARDPVPAIEGVASAPIVREARPSALRLGPAAWLRANLFSSWWSTAVTLLLCYLIVRWGVQFLSWAVVHAVWTVPQTASGGAPDTAACKARIGTGACWAVIGEKYRFILFGRYPYDQQWRAAIVIIWAGSMIVTPGADIVSPVILAVILTLLYFLGIWLTRLVGR